MDISNDRLMRFISSGSGFMAAVDPEGVLKKGVLRTLSFDLAAGGSGWRASVAFGRDGMLALTGRETAGSLTLLSAVFRDGTETVIPMREGRSFFGSVLSLSSLPMGLKAVLSTPSPSAGDGKTGVYGLARSARALLFHGLDPSGADLSLFTGVKFSYSGGQDEEVSISSRYSVPMKGSVLVSAELDCFGMSSRKVYVFKDYGMGYAGKIECLRTWNHETMPSLKLAFDLLDASSMLYTKQRRKKLKK